MMTRLWRGLLPVLLATALAAVHGAAWSQASAATAPGAAASAPARAPAPGVVAWGPSGQVSATELAQAATEMVPADERKTFWLSADAVKRFARSLYTQRALAALAVKTGLDKAPAVAQATGVAREQALARAYLAEQVQAAMPDAAATERYARSEYLAKPDRFTVPEEVRVRHILLPVAKDGSDDAQVKARAEALVEQLRGGADFAALAKAESSDSGSAQRGGELDWFGRGKMTPAFEHAAFALTKPGDISAPVKTPFGWHIIELLERKPAMKLSFEQVLPGLRQEITGRIDAQERGRIWQATEAQAQVDDTEVQALMAQQAKLPKS